MHTVRMSPADTERLYALWVQSMIARTIATRRESGGGPVGRDFLRSAEFISICDLLGLEPAWARTQLAPYAEGQRIIPRLKGNQGRPKRGRKR